MAMILIEKKSNKNSAYIFKIDNNQTEKRKIITHHYITVLKKDVNLSLIRLMEKKFK